jgi:transcriptional regulator with XRE-family HTH domain
MTKVQMEILRADAETADQSDQQAAAITSVLTGLVSRAAATTAAANDGNSILRKDGNALESVGTENEVVLFKGFAERGMLENSKLRAIVGPRLVAARERTGLRQIEAAAILGYGTSAQLCLHETGQRLPPTAELIRIAAAYGCSVDYLLGESDDEVRDKAQGIRDALLRAVRTQIQRVASVTVDAVERHAKLVGPHIGTVNSLLAAGDALLAAVETLCRLNNEALQDMRGGATIIRCAGDFEAELQSARQKVRVHDALDGDLRRAIAEIGE